MTLRLTFALMIGLAIWVISMALVIEWKNAQAGYFLPRRDPEAGTKWRASRGYTELDQLRELVEKVGLLQYLLCPAVVLLSIFHFRRHGDEKNRRLLSIWAGTLGFIALCFAFLRGYFSSLGW